MNETRAELPTQNNVQKAAFSVRSFWQQAGGAAQILPYSNLDSLKVLRRPETWVFFLFFYPVLPFYQSNPSREHVFIFLMVYFALAWAVCFYVFIAKRRTSIWMGATTFLFTRFVSRWFGHLLKYTILAPFYHINESPDGTLKAIGIFGSYGFNEELLKALPILLFAFVVKRIKTPLDGIFCGAISGLSFGAWEGYTYLDDPTKGEVLTVALVRITSGLLMHAAYTGIAGYFIALAVEKRRPLALSALGIAIATTLHGFYDVYINEHGPLIVIFVFLIFIAYADRSQRISTETEETRSVPIKAGTQAVELSQVASGS